MTFFKKQEYGRLYVIKMVFTDGLVVFKIGMTNSDRATDRLMEILRSWFTYYRYIPYTELKLDREVINPAGVEKLAHKTLKDYRWFPRLKTSGSTEMFTGLNEHRLLHFLRNLEADQTAEDIHILGKLLEEQNDS